MKPSTLVFPLLAALALGASACRPGPFIAAPADYHDYRATRLGVTVEDRLLASDTYLSRHPEGVWKDEVRGYYDRIEPLYYGRKQGSIDGLTAYLRALPNGAHRADARRRLDGLEAMRASGNGVVGAADVGAKLDRASADRAKVQEELAAWIERFLDADVWKTPLSEAKAGLIIPWSLALPTPTCASLKLGGVPAGAARSCAKLVELPYAVVVAGASEERQATIEIVVIQDAPGRPLQVTIGGPDLFLRLQETFTVRAQQPGDPSRKADSIGRAVEQVREVFGRVVSRAPACEQPATRPVPLALACRGVRVEVRPSAASGDDDRVVLSPL